MARFADADRETWIEAAERWLPPHELERAARALDQDLRAQYVIGRAIIRIAATAENGSDPQALEIALQAEGKPVLPGSGGLHVSVAHTGQLVAVATTRDAAVGVDVETPSGSGSQLRRLAERVLVPAESERLARLQDSQVALEFCRYWTMKEAIGKALGVRLMQAMSGIELEAEHETLRLARVEIGPPAEEWTVRQRELEGGAELLAVAIAAPDIEVEPIRSLSVQNLRDRRLCRGQ